MEFAYNSYSLSEIQKVLLCLLITECFSIDVISFDDFESNVFEIFGRNDLIFNHTNKAYNISLSVFDANGNF